MNEKELAKKILETVGGAGNVEKSWHCATRLRIVPLDQTKIDEEAIKKIEGVLGLVQQGEQYQVIIGNRVNRVYEQFQELVDQPSAGQVKAPTSAKKSETPKQNIFSRLLGALVGSITPLIPVLVAGGMGKCLVLILKMANVLSDQSQTYQILLFIFDSAFYFLPVFVAISAAKQFKANMYLAALLGCALIHPVFVEMIKSGGKIALFGIPVISFSYTSTIIPAILAVWVLSHVGRFLDKHLWVSIQRFMSPLLSILIVVPLTMIVIGPAMSYVSLGLSEVIFFLSGKLGFLSIAIFAMIYPWIVTTGMHSALAIAGLEAINKNGFDPFTRVLTLLHNITQASATLAIALKTKNKAFKGTAISASLTAFFAGITEPCLYGATLKLKKPMYACMIGGFAGGLYAGIVGIHAYVFMTPGIISLPMWINPAEPSNLSNLWHAVIAMVIAGVVSFIATLVLGFEDIPESEEDNQLEAVMG
ncbi:PTS transporter subunit EIIC [Isobaculum melis]|uniref:PTS system, beta-glucosides-specific IIC component n=1 Tax=Isobaculum melis TaxID=142588 RepID=A0A1H9U913_9LACT|nr:PTS transporter subunit EIIC [Isobaculum melis]SES06070.1 PTS system, beta-glucosides-specific IIC component [Isobaculum melis]